MPDTEVAIVPDVVVGASATTQLPLKLQMQDDWWAVIGGQYWVYSVFSVMPVGVEDERNT